MLPLKGLKVLDFSHAADGPMCGFMLAEAGADVIKVEPLHGEPYRQGGVATAFFNANRNKRSLAIDLRKPEGLEIALKLAAGSDILLESFTPGTASNMGIGYEEISRINPRIIYCSISGFGQTGPYSQRPAYDPVIQAMSGFMAVTGEDGRQPVRVGPGVIGLGTAFIAAYGILLAVMMREKDGKSRYIDAAFFDTAIFFMSSIITGYSLTGLSLPRMGSSNPVFVPYQCFKASDRYVFIGVTQELFWHGFCRAINMEYLEKDIRFVTNARRLEHRSELLKILEPATSKFNSADLLSRLEDEGVPCAPVQGIGEVIDDPQVRSRHMLCQVEYPGAGNMLMSRLPLKMTNLEQNKVRRPPLLGEHSEEILLELGYSSDKIDALRRDGIILERLA